MTTDGFNYLFQSETKDLESGVLRCWYHLPFGICCIDSPTPTVHIATNHQTTGRQVHHREWDSMVGTIWSTQASCRITEHSKGLGWPHCEYPCISNSLSVSSEVDKARLELAASSKHSEEWLLSSLISFVGLKLSHEAIRVAVTQRLGYWACKSHIYAKKQWMPMVYIVWPVGKLERDISVSQINDKI